MSMKYNQENINDFDFYNIHPVGIKKVTEINSILPNYNNGSSFCVGLNNINVNKQFSILFQINEGFANKSTEDLNLKWFYYDGSKWQTMNEDQLIKDNTNGFKHSGIVELNLEKTAFDKSGLFSSDSIWFKVESLSQVSFLPFVQDVLIHATTATFLTQKIHLKASLIRNPEVMAIDSDSHEEHVAAMSNQDVFVCGPGLSSSSWSKSMLTKLINHLNKNMGAVVFDAGALRMLAKDFLSTHNIKSSIVLTPHPGEAADLLGITIKEVQLDRINAAKKIATQYKATVILKGAGSIVTDGSEVYICDEGGPELATGGTGDILAGLVGSLIAQGLSANNASLLAVATHGLAGKEFKDICGENGLAASELIPLIRKILNNK